MIKLIIVWLIQLKYGKIDLMLYDLHCHSTASDGSLTPTQLVEFAQSKAIDYLSLTDHDTIEGLKEAQIAAQDKTIKLINGIEFSVTWQAKTVHIVGLKINPESKLLLERINVLQKYRRFRAQEISMDLDNKAQIKNALQGAELFSQSKMIGRVHFAQFLVHQGYAKDIKQAFKKFLVKNKPGYIKDSWASLADIIECIHQANGIAVIAHPARYGLKLKKLKQLVDEFKSLGGQAIEVVSGSQCTNEIPKINRLAEEFNLYASIGSDFHSQDMPWNNLGQFPELPINCKPVSELLN